MLRRVALTSACLSLVGLSIIAATEPANAYAPGAPYVSAPGSVLAGSPVSLSPGAPVTPISGLAATQRVGAAGINAGAVQAGKVIVPRAGIAAANVTGSGSLLLTRAGVAGVGLYAGFEGANTVMIMGGVDPNDVGMAGIHQIITGQQMYPDTAWIPNPGIVTSTPGFEKPTVIENVLISTNPDISWSGSYGIDSTGVQYGASSMSLPSTLAVHAWLPSQETGPWNLQTNFNVGQPRCKQPNGSFVTGEGGSFMIIYKGPGTAQQITRNVGVNCYGWIIDYVPIRVQTGTNAIGDPVYKEINKWYPPNHPNYPAETSTNPERNWETRWRCNDVAKSAVSPNFTHTDPEFPPFPNAVCPTGTTPTEVTVWQVSPDGEKLVKDWTSPNPQFNDWIQSFPQCQTQVCRLVLSRIDPNTGARLDCLENPSACVNWSTDPARDTKYKCTYAGVDIALAECAPYATTPNVLTKTDYVGPDGKPIPAESLLPLADPATGTPMQKPATSTNPDTSTETNVSRDCPPPFEMTLGGIGYWVTKGVTCALTATFIPSPATVNAWNAKVGVWSNTPPISIATGGFNWFNELRNYNGGDTCSVGSFCDTKLWDIQHTVYIDPIETVILWMDEPGGVVLYNFQRMMLIVAFIYFAWKRIAQSFGSKEVESS